jgi:hypothetical protein
MNAPLEEPRTGARARLRAFFEANLGRVLSHDELRPIARINEWPRRIRELRDQEGMQILTDKDRATLKPGQYLLETLERRPVMKRGLDDKLRQAILERDASTCQACGAAAGEESGCVPGRRTRLQIDHLKPVSQGGTDEPSNLRAVCDGFNQRRSNLKNVSETALNVLVAVRKLPRDAQLEVYQFLKSKFEPR